METTIIIRIINNKSGLYEEYSKTEDMEANIYPGVELLIGDHPISIVPKITYNIIKKVKIVEGKVYASKESHEVVELALRMDGFQFVGTGKSK